MSSLTLVPSTDVKSDALTAAEALVNAVVHTESQLTHNRMESVRLLWKQMAYQSDVNDFVAVDPSCILAELSGTAQRQIVNADICQRLALAVRAPNPLLAFMQSTPVPSTKTLKCKDASGTEVSFDAEVVQLLQKFATVASIEVSTKTV